MLATLGPSESLNPDRFSITIPIGLVSCNELVSISPTEAQVLHYVRCAEVAAFYAHAERSIISDLLALLARKYTQRGAVPQSSSETKPPEVLMNTRWNAMVGSTPSSRAAGPAPTEFIGTTKESSLIVRDPI